MFKIALIVGGTNTVCALFSNNRLIRKIERQTRSDKGRKFMIQNIVDMVNEVRGDRKIIGVGFGVPGLIDREKGVVKKAKLPWINIPLKKILQKKLKTRIFFENDAKCAALGVLKTNKTKNFVLITLGTGLGGAIVIDGKLYTGMGNSAEFGHIIVKDNGPRCKCGKRGCLQQYVAAPGFHRLSKKYFSRKMSPLEIEKMARKGDKKAKRIYEEIGKCLGAGLAIISNTLNPDVIYFTGKISKSGSLLLGPARKEMKKRIFVSPPSLVVEKEDMELYGAASLVCL